MQMTTQTITANHSLEFYSPEDLQADPSLRTVWESLVHLGNPLNGAYLGPAPFETHAKLAPHEGNRVVMIRDGDGKVIGICPVVHWKLEMPFQVRRRIFGKLKLEAATVLSGEPLLPQDPALFRLLIEGLLREMSWCDCIYFNSIPADCYTTRFIYGEEGRLERYFVYPRRLQPREWIYLELEESYEKFLQGKQTKTRNTWKRRVKKLRELGGGVLECDRIENEDQVGAFYEAANSVAEKSWQFRTLGRALEETALYRDSLRSLARQGCLRAYLLRCGERPCAFWIGLQDNDVLQLEQSAYSCDFAIQSPGTVLHYMLMEDVYRHRRPKFLNYGTGVNPHKRLFANRDSSDTAIHLFRPTLRNRLRAASHGMFYSGLELVKKLSRKRAGAPAPSEDDES
jgi:hypothetical protein